MAHGPRREWSPADVPPGPYLHGSRRFYEVGECLITGVVNNIEGEEDDRQMCFATTSMDEALDWAYRRGIRHGGRTLYVYEIEMADPQVDVNAHPPGTDGPITSVMSPCGRVLAVANEVALEDYPHTTFGVI